MQIDVATLNIIINVGVVAFAFWRIAARLSNMEMKLNMIWNWYKKEHKILDDGKPD